MGFFSLIDSLKTHSNDNGKATAVSMVHKAISGMLRATFSRRLFGATPCPLGKYSVTSLLQLKCFHCHAFSDHSNCITDYSLVLFCRNGPASTVLVDDGSEPLPLGLNRFSNRLNPGHPFDSHYWFVQPTLFPGQFSSQPRLQKLNFLFKLAAVFIPFPVLRLRYEGPYSTALAKQQQHLPSQLYNQFHHHHHQL